MTIDIHELREKASLAASDNNAMDWYTEKVLKGQAYYWPEHDPAFIAACDPQTILSLLNVAENASVLLKELDVSDDTQECVQALAALSESLVAIGAYQQD